MNVVTDLWIPVIRKDGTRDIINPTQITSNYENPIISLNLGRPDLNAATLRLLVSFYNTFLSPTSKKQWKDLFKAPPNSKKISLNFKSEFFELDGKSVRFLQDKKPDELKKICNVGSLLFDTPGTKTIEDGKDFFQKAKKHTFCVTCSIAALYLKQYSAVMAGVGYRTSITSGANGSLASFIVGNTVWETIWSNVIIQKEMFKLGGNPKGLIFPWLSDTKDSTTKDTISLDTVHPYYPLWEMPLRLHLFFEEDSIPCTICGSNSKLMVNQIKIKNYGNCYINPRHIYSPYIKDKGYSFIKPKSSLDYSNILTFLYPADKTYPAEVINHFMGNIDFLKRNTVELWVFGYHMDKAKLYSWEEKKFTISELIYNNKESAIQLARLSYLIGWYICNSMRKIWTVDKIDSVIIDDFMRKTEGYFYKALKTKDLKEWVDSMVIKAFDIFEKHMGDYKYGLQWYYKTDFINNINKKVIKPLELKNLDIQNFIHIEYQKLHLPHFEKEFSDLFLSWFGKIRMTNKFKKVSRNNSIEELCAQESFIGFIKLVSQDYPEFKKEEVKKKLAITILIILKAKEIDFSKTFPIQLALGQIDPQLVDDVLQIKDAEKDWKKFQNIIVRIKGVNVMSFSEGFMHWNSDIKSYWKKEIIKLTNNNQKIQRG